MAKNVSKKSYLKLLALTQCATSCLSAQPEPKPYPPFFANREEFDAHLREIDRKMDYVRRLAMNQGKEEPNVNVAKEFTVGREIGYPHVFSTQQRMRATAANDAKAANRGTDKLKRQAKPTNLEISE